MNHRLIWNDKLRGRYESDVSLIWKLAFINRLTGRDELMRAEEAGSELLWGSGMRGPDSWRDFPEAMVARPHLRYCATCLRFGYLSDFFQLAGLALCPIHKEPLLDHCHCGAQMPRIDLAEYSFEPAPFHCKSCRQPIARPFDPNLFFDAPKEIHAHESAFDSFAAWIHRLLNGTLSPSVLGYFEDSFMAHAPEPMKGTMVMWMLMGIEPLDCDLGLLRGTPVSLSASAFEPETERIDSATITQEQYAMYLTIRRRLRRRTARLPGCGKYKRALRGTEEAPLAASTIPEAVTAFLRWRDAMQYPYIPPAKPPQPSKMHRQPRVKNRHCAGSVRAVTAPLTEYARPITINERCVAPIRIWGRFAVATYAAMRAYDKLDADARQHVPWPRRMSLIVKRPHCVLIHHRISPQTMEALP